MAAAVAMLLVTPTKERVSAPAWFTPAVVVVPFMARTGIAIFEGGLFGFLPTLMESHWGLQIWFDPYRARAAGMKSEVWVLAVIFTFSIGLFLMLTRTVYIERKTAA